ncbi:MAG: aspartate aminotransferase family protein [Lachnospirales bacterium]
MSLKDKDKRYISNTYKRFDVEIEKGKNATCFDFSGKEYIDFTSGIGVNSLGFANEKINNAIVQQINKISHISNLYYTEPCIKLSEKLCEISKMDKVFFANSGAEANEGAIKAARKYSFDKYGADRNEIITLNKSFHGRTMATLSATGQDYFHNYFHPFLEGFLYADADIKSISKKISSKTCAVMIEMIQGEGGVLPVDNTFVKELESLCNELDILLIIDEVQTGIGRTGKFFAHEYAQIKPDIVTVAKGLGGGLPIGAILFNEKVGGVFTYGNHGSTFGGNPVVCASALVVVDEIADEGFLNEVIKKGEHIEKKLLDLPHIKNVFYKGLMFGIEIDIEAIDVVNKAIENGLLLLTAKSKLRFLPPLTISYEELNKGLEILSKVMLDLK